LEVRVLGSLEVVDDLGRPIAVRGARLSSLLIALALRCGEAVSDDRLSEILWGDDARSGVNALQRQVSTLRRVLGRTDLIARRGQGYVLCLDKEAVDAFRFETLAARGRDALREGDVADASASLHAALDLWRGDPLAEVDDDPFVGGVRTWLAELRIATLEARIDADLAMGRHAELVAELEQLVRAHPMREHLQAQLMLALSRSGRQTEALRAFRAARAVLATEAGLEPSPELRALEVAILHQDESTVRRDPEPDFAPDRPRLRTPLSSFFGRRDELDELTARLRRRRLVTLVGPGGVGKSRLALEAAKEVVAAGPTDVWLVELADVTEPDGIVSAIAAALGLPIGVDATIDLSRIVDFLCGRSALVMLDNCEHLVESAAHVTEDLLELCPTLRVLATSRERLGVPGEAVFRVPPLGLTDAVALFVERGYAVAPVSDLVDEGDVEWPLLESICARLDCLPLAIEIAASRLASMPIRELVVGLTDRFRLLERGARTARPRQQTLRAVVDWSYDLLFDDERRVLDRLSVFTGGCDLSAARAVCADDNITPDDVSDLITRLAEKSLVMIEAADADGRIRCRMLETLVEYGRDRLAASGDTERVRRAHARYYRDLAIESVAALRGERQREWLQTIASNLGNLRAVFEAALAGEDAETALVIAGSLGWYWWFTGRAAEGSRWLSLARAHCGATDGVARARVLAWTAFTGAPGFVLWTDQTERSLTLDTRPGADLDELCETAISEYRELGVVDELAGIETALSVAYSTRGNHTRAIELLRDADQILSGLGSAEWVPAMRAYVTARLAFVEDRVGDAEAAFRASLPLLDAIGGEVHESFAYRYLGRLSALRSDHEGSITAIQTALGLARELGLSGFADVLLTDLSASLAAGGEFDRARGLLAQQLAVARDHRSPTGICASLAALAWVEWSADNHVEAAHLAAEALETEGGDDHETATLCRAILGLAEQRRGDVAGARAHFHRGLDAARRSRQPRRLALALEGLAVIAIAEQDGWTAARLGAAATTLRQAPGRATGWAFASAAPIDLEHVVDLATGMIGAAEVSAAHAESAADPLAVIAAIGAPTAG
jgi:predicted ATPase/DNA-binding SARP family transcriptional activator